MSRDDQPKTSSELNNELPIFEQSPPPTEQDHPVNAMKYMGTLFKTYRSGLPKAVSGGENFCELILKKYTSEGISRSKLTRAQSGDPNVKFDVIAAFFSEMGIWSDIHYAMEFSTSTNSRYLKLAYKEIKSDVKVARAQAAKNLQNIKDSLRV